MAEATIREPLTVRLRAEDKEFFSSASERSGLEPSVAARQILELVIQRMRSDGDFVVTLGTLNGALRAG